MKHSILMFKSIGTAVIALIVCAIPYVVVGIATPAAAQTIQPQTISTQITATAVAECNKRGWCFVTTTMNENLCVPCDGSCFALETTANAVPVNSTYPMNVYWGFPYSLTYGRYKASDLKGFVKYAQYPRNTILSTYGCLIVNTTRKTIDFKAGSEYFRIQYGLTAN